MLNASRYQGLWLVLLTAGSLAACSSPETGSGNNNNQSGSSSGGSPSTGGSGGAGTTAGTGTAGSGTSGSATGGSTTGGSGGSGGGSGFACAGTKPASNLITEFADLTASAAGQFTFVAGVPGGTFSYEPADVMLMNASGALNVTGTVKTYDGFGIYFTACTDASAYTGVSFNIRGNAGPTGMLSFRIQTNATTAVDSVNKKGSCVVPPGTVDAYAICHAAMFNITVAPAGGVVEVKFSDVMGGAPVATVDGKDILGLEWAFPWAGPTDTMYPVDVTVDDIKFTGGSAGGSGGAGGGGGGGGTGGTGGSAGSGGGGGTGGA
jgi:hypothetical protein